MKVNLSYKGKYVLGLLTIGVLLSVFNCFSESIIVFSMATAVLIICFVLASVYFCFRSIGEKSHNNSLVSYDYLKKEIEYVDEHSEDLENVLESIHKWFHDSKCYLNPEYSLDQLQDDVEIDRKRLSLAINKVEGMNFYQFIAYYRIKYATSILKSSDKYTLESLSTECGFYSKSSFNKYFKHFEGETPSRFKLKQI